MRRLIWFCIAILTSTQALAQALEPDVVGVRIRDVVPTHWKGAEVPDLKKFATAEGRSKLGDFIRDCITRPYSQKRLSDGIYVSDPTPDDTLNDLPGVRVRAIVPSELFRDSYADWDGFEVVAAFEVPKYPRINIGDQGRLWILAMNYRYRGRGGITLSGPKPSPDWDYSSLSDLDAANGRLRKIQDAIRERARVGRRWKDPEGCN